MKTTTTTTTTTTTDSITEAYATLGAALEVADRDAAASLVAAAVGMPVKACGRCGGRGLVTLASGAPGGCFRCGGSGEVLAKRSDVAKLDVVRAAAEEARLRATWRAVHAALTVAEAVAAAPGAPRSAKGTAVSLAKRLDTVTRAVEALKGAQ